MTQLPPGVQVAWYFDFISPYAYLQFAAHPDLFKLPGLALKPLLTFDHAAALIAAARQGT